MHHIKTSLSTNLEMDNNECLYHDSCQCEKVRHIQMKETMRKSKGAEFKEKC